MKNIYRFLLLPALLLYGLGGFAQKSNQDKKSQQNRTIPKEVRTQSWDPVDIPDEDDDDYENDKDYIDDKKSGRAKMGTTGKAGYSRSDLNSKKQKSPDNPNIERKAREESLRLAQTFGIKNKDAQKKLLKACRKYLKALDHLERDYGISGPANRTNTPSGGLQGSPKGGRGKNSEAYQKRKEELGLAYGQELRKILPES